MAIKILSPSSFRQQQARGAQGKGSYQGYLRALARHTGMSVDDLLARRDTNAVYIPAARAISQSILQNAGLDVGRVNARTGAIQRALAPYPASERAFYGAANQETGAIGQGLQSALAQSGQQIGADLTGKFSQIQAPGQTTSQFAGGAVSTGAGAGEAIGGLSSAEQSKLTGYQSAAEIYASALPRLAQLAGDAEKRNIMQQYAQELADKQAAATQAEQAAYLDNQRYYAQLQRQKAQDAYARAEDAYNRKRQAKLDAIAQQAAAQEYGLKVAGANTAAGNLQARINAENNRHQEAMQRAQDSEARARETARHNRAMEGLKGASGGGQSDRAKQFYKVRDQAFKQAAAYGNPKSKLADKMPRPVAMKRLQAQYGRQLRGMGYSQKSINAMLNAALVAAGY